MAVEAKPTNRKSETQHIAVTQDTLLKSTLKHLDTLAAALGGSHHKQGAVEWWTYWLEGRILTVRYEYAAQQKGAYTVYTREAGTFSATEERSRQYFGEATVTQLERSPLPLEEALVQLGTAVLQKKHPQLIAQIENIVQSSQAEAYVFIRLSDLEFFVQFGAVESLEGCLYLFSIPIPQTHKAASSHAA